MNKQIKNALFVVGGAVAAFLIYRNLVNKKEDNKKNADGKKCYRCSTPNNN